MKIKLFKFLEHPEVRIRLQTEIDLDTVPAAGWYIEGITTRPTLDIIIDKVVVHPSPTECTYYCLIKPSNAKEGVTKDNFITYVKDSYGPNWKMNIIHLTLDDLKYAIAKQR